MENTELKVGDVVRLKSGSPKAIVIEIRNEEFAICIFFNEVTQKVDYFTTILKNNCIPILALEVLSLSESPAQES